MNVTKGALAHALRESSSENKTRGSRRGEAGYLEAQYMAYREYIKALKSGLLGRQPCVVCGSTKNIDGHHEDYSKPLEVTWLCRKHHKIRHAELMRANWQSREAA